MSYPIDCSSSNPTHARCPDCNELHPVEWQDELPPGGYWWANSLGCPGCGAVVCVESECEFERIEQGDDS